MRETQRGGCIRGTERSSSWVGQKAPHEVGGVQGETGTKGKDQINNVMLKILGFILRTLVIH